MDLERLRFQPNMPNGPGMNGNQRFNLPGAMSPGNSPSGYSPPGGACNRNRTLEPLGSVCLKWRNSQLSFIKKRNVSNRTIMKKSWSQLFFCLKSSFEYVLIHFAYLALLFLLEFFRFKKSQFLLWPWRFHVRTRRCSYSHCHLAQRALPPGWAGWATSLRLGPCLTLAAGQRQQPVVCSPNHSKVVGIFGKSFTATLDHLVTWSCIMTFISPLCTGRCLWIHPIVIVRILNASA